MALPYRQGESIRATVVYTEYLIVIKILKAKEWATSGGE
jgi:hypothetical protein